MSFLVSFLGSMVANIVCLSGYVVIVRCFNKASHVANLKKEIAEIKRKYTENLREGSQKIISIREPGQGSPSLIRVVRPEDSAYQV